jgi:hypothetical protein
VDRALKQSTAGKKRKKEVQFAEQEEEQFAAEFETLSVSDDSEDEKPSSKLKED